MIYLVSCWVGSKKAVATACVVPLLWIATQPQPHPHSHEWPPDDGRRCVWAVSLGGPAVPPRCATREQPMTLGYVGASIVVDRGRGLLGFVRLREGASWMKWVGRCCHTILCIDHPCMEGNAVLIFPDIAVHTVRGRPAG